MILSCVQPSYLAWIPFFKRMIEGDIFVYLDDVQYSKNSFHNRNRIRGKEGDLLLTVPVRYSGNSESFLCDITIDNNSKWKKKHWLSIEYNYNKSRFFNDIRPKLWEQIYSKDWNNLSDLNIALIEFFKDFLEIKAKTIRSSDLDIKSQGNQKLIDMCKLLGADKFVVKPNTTDYHPEDFFMKQGISFHHFNPKASKYPQQHKDFIPNLSVLDYAMNCGKGKLLW